MTIGATTAAAAKVTTLDITSTLALAGSTGTAGYVLTSNGASAPTWQANANGLAIADDTTTNATRYLTFTDATTGNITTGNVSSTKLQFNPSTGALTATSLTPTNAIGVAYGGTGATTLTGILKGNGTSAFSAATAGTDYAGIDTAQTFTKGQRGEITALVDGATITPDFADSNNFSVTLGGNRTLANPSNIVAGQSGSFFITQDGTGSRTLAYGSYYDFAGGTAPTLSTAAGAIDRIDYVVRTTTSIHAVFTANYS
jgi:hypothetical protein